MTPSTTTLGSSGFASKTLVVQTPKSARPCWTSLIASTPGASDADFDVKSGVPTKSLFERGVIPGELKLM
jgi:hypothetical protein